MHRSERFRKGHVICLISSTPGRIFFNVWYGFWLYPLHFPCLVIPNIKKDSARCTRNQTTDMALPNFKFNGFPYIPEWYTNSAMQLACLGHICQELDYFSSSTKFVHSCVSWTKLNCLKHNCFNKNNRTLLGRNIILTCTLLHTFISFVVFYLILRLDHPIHANGSIF